MLCDFLHCILIKLFYQVFLFAIQKLNLRASSKQYVGCTERTIVVRKDTTSDRYIASEYMHPDLM